MSLPPQSDFPTQVGVIAGAGSLLLTIVLTALVPTEVIGEDLSNTARIAITIALALNAGEANKLENNPSDKNC